MSLSESFLRRLDRQREIVEADGVIDIGETACLLRLARIYAARGGVAARQLADLLIRVRKDGVITPDESKEVIAMLESILSGKLALADFVREIRDFPKPGVLFRDVTGMLESTEGFRRAIDLMESSLEGLSVDLVAAPESRGFLFGAALADRLRVAFAPIRKPGKLPRETVSEKYDLEYGQAELHMHKDAVLPGERAAIVDDLLATGGTAAASARLVERLGGRVVKMIFPVELEGFKARENALKGYDVESLVKFPGR